MSEPIGEVYERLNKLKMFLMARPDGAAFKDIKAHMGKDRFMILRDLETIGAKPAERGVYVYSPTPEDLALAESIQKAVKPEPPAVKPTRRKIIVISEPTSEKTVTGE